MKVRLEGEFNDLWAEEIFANMPNATDEEKQEAVIECIQEDVIAFLDRATWVIELSEKERGR